MGKKGSWFSALKRAFTSSSKGPEKQNAREKKGWGLGRSKNGETNNFIPLYREPSSIEKILGDAEREQKHKIFGGAERERYHKVLGVAEREQHHRAFGSSEREQHYKVLGDAEREQQRITSGVIGKENHKALGDAEREQHPKLQVPSKKVQRSKTPASRPTVTPNHAQISAIKIQAAYRGYMARRSYRALKGLVRLQGVMRGHSVKRQTMNAMRSMQLLVRVQSQIRARRLQMMETRSFLHNKSDKEAESSKWSFTHPSEAEAHEEWDDSVLTKEEIDARMQRKVEAVIKRERALAYAYSHQLLKVTPKSAHAVLSDIRTGGYPWWWNWLERHVPPETPAGAARPRPSTPKPATPLRPGSNRGKPVRPMNDYLDASTPLRPGSNRGKPARPMNDYLEASTPRSAKPLSTPRAKHQSSNRWQASQTKPATLRDDESLTSCPAYTVPRYMTPTASAKAKVRTHDGGSGDEGKRGFMFGLGSSIGSLGWGKAGSLFAANKEPVSHNAATAARHRSTHSIGGMSVDSTVSLPAGVGRKPFR